MSEFEDNIIEEDNPVLHLELKDGTVMDCAVVAIFEAGPQTYIALIPVEELDSEEEETALLLYRYVVSPEDEESFDLENIEDDEEYKLVTDTLDEILEESIEDGDSF